MKQIRKICILCIVGVTLMLTITGCTTTVENKVKEIEKDIDISSINNLDSDKEKSVEEKKDSEIEKEEHIQNASNNNNANTNTNNNTNVTNNTNDNNNKDGIEYNQEVRYVDMLGDNGPYIVVYGYGNNGQILWEYKSKPDTIGAQCSSVGFIVHDKDHGSVIIQELNTIKALDDRTGKEKWTFEGYDEQGSQGTYDQDGNIYLFTVTYRLYVIDKNGKLKKCIDVGKLVPQGAELPLLHSGISAIDMYSAAHGADEKKVSVIYDVGIDKNGESIDTTYRMIIDTINEKVKIETIATCKYVTP